jgi:hypothetical protein
MLMYVGRCRDWLRIERLPPSEEGPLTTRNLQLIDEWLGSCATRHASCKRIVDPSQPHFVPTRLIDTGIGSGSDVTLVNARKGLVIGKRVQYAALSYCWGSAVSFTTTTATLAECKDSISLASLPIVFQEAILVVRTLGIRYLWIDALCIIQDDAADWERESAQMSYVFAYAFVTIAAAASTACDQSFLNRSPKPAINIPFQSTLDPLVKGTYTISTEPMLGDDMGRDYEKSRWNSRAWVYQERTLTTRLLVFGATMLQMQCREVLQQEDGLRRPTYNKAFTESGFEPEWAIHEYSKKSLTFRRDRLGAIVGVARLVSKALTQKGFDVNYLAGIWLIKDSPQATGYIDCLPYGSHPTQQLTEKIHDPGYTFQQLMTVLTSQDTYCAPSWSWASKDEQAGHGAPTNTQTVFKILRWHLPACHLDPMIAVKPGSYIVLRGVMRSFALTPPDGVIQYSQEVLHQAKLDTRGDPYEDFGIVKCDFDWKTAPGEDEEIKQRLKTLIVSRHRTRDVFGLLLLPAGDNVEDDEFIGRPITQDTCTLMCIRSSCEKHTVHVLKQSYRRVGVFSSRGWFPWVDECPLVDVTIL